MRLIIGGAYQGKLEYALRVTGFARETFLDGKNCEMEAIFGAKGINGFHEYVKRYLEIKDGGVSDPAAGVIDSAALMEELAEELWQRNPQLVLITNELGYGVVPCDGKDRRWREATGRICTKLAKKAEKVTRVVCGIGMDLKHESESND